MEVKMRRPERLEPPGPSSDPDPWEIEMRPTNPTVHFGDKRVPARLWNWIYPMESGCWIWAGVIGTTGYGHTNFGRGCYAQVHRTMYEMTVGSIPTGLYVCHSCDVRSCVNPAHLWVGSQKDNLADMLAKGRHYKQRRTACDRGHEFDHSNTYRIPGSRHRVCKACHKISSARWLAGRNK